MSLAVKSSSGLFVDRPKGKSLVGIGIPLGNSLKLNAIESLYLFTRGSVIVKNMDLPSAFGSFLESFCVYYCYSQLRWSGYRVFDYLSRAKDKSKKTFMQKLLRRIRAWIDYGHKLLLNKRGEPDLFVWMSNAPKTEPPLLLTVYKWALTVFSYVSCQDTISVDALIAKQNQIISIVDHDAVYFSLNGPIQHCTMQKPFKKNSR